MTHEPTPIASLTWSGQSDRARRPNNEDAFLCLQFDGREVRYLGKMGEANFEHGDFVFAVSDGMGGAKAGEFASKIAVEKITRLLPRSFKLSAQGMNADVDDVLAELIDQIHGALLHLGNSYEECRGMGATLSLAWFTPGWVYWAHVGDSRIYYIPKAGPWRQVTQDDTYVGWLQRTGQINEREARTHPRKNALQKALGAGHQFVEPQLGAISCEPGDRFLLCTDGVLDGFFDAALMEAARTSDAADLVAVAVKSAGRDNATAVIIETHGA